MKKGGWSAGDVGNLLRDLLMVFIMTLPENGVLAPNQSPSTLLISLSRLFHTIDIVQSIFVEFKGKNRTEVRFVPLCFIPFCAPGFTPS